MPTDLPLFGAAMASDRPETRALISEPAPTLPAMQEGEAIGRDYTSMSLTLRRRPLALLRPILSRLRCDDTRTLARTPQGRRLRIPGLVLMRQQPMTAKGVIFVTIEDEHGQANVVVYTHIAERDRAPLPTSGLIFVDGRVEREDQHSEVSLIHLIASRLIDRSDLLQQLAAISGDGMPGTEPVRPPRMPATRDFR